LPRGIRWLAGAAAAVLALAVAWALFVPAADALAHHDVGSVTGTLHETALDNARGRLLTLSAGLAALVAVGFTARTFYLSRQGQVTDRYTKAVEQLGSDKLDVRIGGIYALERIARDSARDHPVVMEVLTAFIREHSREWWPLAGPDEDEEDLVRLMRPDVQAALTVVVRRDVKRDARTIDLAGAYLDRANLAGADLRGANLAGAVLTMASLGGADLGGANLYFASLGGAQLDGANFTLAKLDGANLSFAKLISAKLINAKLINEDLQSAILDRADLTGADLTGALWPADAVPEGWELDAGSGRLQRAGTGPAPAGPPEAGTTPGSPDGGTG